MKAAQDNIVQFERFSVRASEFSARIPSGIVYAAQRMRSEEHDGRGLTIAILLCMACWAALGYYLLS